MKPTTMADVVRAALAASKCGGQAIVPVDEKARAKSDRIKRIADRVRRSPMPKHGDRIVAMDSGPEGACKVTFQLDRKSGDIFVVDVEDMPAHTAGKSADMVIIDDIGHASANAETFDKLMASLKPASTPRPWQSHVEQLQQAAYGQLPSVELEVEMTPELKSVVEVYEETREKIRAARAPKHAMASDPFPCLLPKPAPTVYGHAIPGKKSVAIARAFALSIEPDLSTRAWRNR